MHAPYAGSCAWILPDINGKINRIRRYAAVEAATTGLRVEYGPDVEK
jgi:hypothetical protein